MPRLSLSLAALAAVFHFGATPAMAQTAPTATPGATFSAPTSAEDRAAFGAAVRAYLMEHPEVIFEAAAEYERRNAAAQADMDKTLVEINADAIFHDGHSWVGGNPDGDLTLVEFMDYRCAYCRRANPQMLSFLNEDGNVRLVIKEFPILGPQSEVMSRFAIAVQHFGTDAQYFDAHERLLAWDGDFTEASARELAAAVGVDADQVLGYMGSDAVSTILSENHQLAQRLQITGTPTFVIGAGDGGEMLRGYLPANELHSVATRLRG